MNPGGSVKDRIGRRMIIDAEKKGELKKGDIIIEPTSGNTGIGLSMTAACRGYNMIITMPEKMSQEKQDALRGLGATIVRTPTSYAFDHLYSHIGIAGSLKEKLGDRAHVLDQYKNTGNPMAHYEETAEEIWDQTEGKVDVVVMGTGTGGTITGVARKLKELNPNIQIVGVDPEGSILAQPASMNVPGPDGGQQTEGIGYDFIPRVIDRTVVDHWINGPDKESFLMARRMLREEGMMCGGSSGTAMWAAIKYIKENNIGKDKTVVALCPDNIRNYMTKHLNADWMYERGYFTESECMEINKPKFVEIKDWGQDLKVGDLPANPAHFMQADDSVRKVLDAMRENSFDQFPIKNNGKTVGVVTKKILLERLGKSQIGLDDPVTPYVDRYIRQVSKAIPLNELTRILLRNSFALIEDHDFVTMDDLLTMMHPKASETPAQAEPSDKAVSSNLLKMTSVGVCGMAAGALAFKFMNQ